MSTHIKHQLTILAKTALFMAIGIALFKFVPMYVFGADILFDASLHITSALFGLYVLWFFIDQNKSWHLPFFLFATVVLSVIATQRILVSAHNDIGLLGGLIVSGVSIYLANPTLFKNKIRF